MIVSGAMFADGKYRIHTKQDKIFNVFSLQKRKLNFTETVNGDSS